MKMRIPRLSSISRGLWGQAIKRIYPMLDGTPALEGEAFPADYAMVPFANSKRIGWTHYGVMIPDLPAPHRFFSIMSIIGTPGALAFDTDHALKTSPRRNATLVCGTAATHPDHFAGYSIDRDCDFPDEGGLVRFGDEVEILGEYPDFRVTANIHDLRLQIDLRCTDKVTWFLKTPVYDHLSLLCDYQGTLEWKGTRTEIAGQCTYEYAACPSPYLVRDRPLPRALKLPVDFFTYQIINLEDGVQLLLTQIGIAGNLAVSKVYVRGRDEYNRTYLAAEFDVIRYREPAERTPDGRRMNLPDQFEWRVAADDGTEVLSIRCTCDTPFTYGLGSGYVGGYRYEGEFRGLEIGGRGYIEYIDRREE